MSNPYVNLTLSALFDDCIVETSLKRDEWEALSYEEQKAEAWDAFGEAWSSVTDLHWEASDADA